MTQQILTIIAQQFILVLIIASVTFLLGLIFEKQLTALYEKITSEYRNRKADKEEQERLALIRQKEADRRKVEKIRENFNREMENTGIICVPYYAAS